MKVLAVRDDGAQLAADPEMFYGVLVTSDGSGIIPVATALAHGDWRDGDGDASVPAHLSEMARLASAERDELDQRWQVPWPERSEKVEKDAAFILFRAPNDDGKMRYLLQNRSDGTWGLPGGRLHSGEDPWAGALRESEEELGSLPAGLKPRMTLVSKSDLADVLKGRSEAWIHELRGPHGEWAKDLTAELKPSEPEDDEAATIAHAKELRNQSRQLSAAARAAADEALDEFAREQGASDWVAFRLALHNQGGGLDDRSLSLLAQAQARSDQAAAPLADLANQLDEQAMSLMDQL